MRVWPASGAGLLLSALSMSASVPGTAATEVILAPRAAITDQVPDARFDASAVVGELRRELGPGSGFTLISLGPDRLLSLDDRAVLIVPVITSARTSREVKADSIVEVVAHVSGGLWVLDPWTNAALYTTTRLVSAPIQVTKEDRSQENELIRGAFSRALARWTADCLAQLRENVSPFVVDGLSGTVPRGAEKTGGVWLRGTAHGVRPGMVARSEDGSLARVEAAAEKFSSLRDLSDGNARIPAGKRFRAIAVRNPGDRPEPIVVLQWLGKPLESNEVVGGAMALSSASVVDIVQNYAARGGGLRVVPASAGGLAGSGEFRELSDLVSRHAKLATGATGMTIHRESAIRLAEDEPDIVSEVGVVGAYHGTRELPDSTIEHLFRVSLLGSVGTPLPDGGWVLANTVEVTEERAVVEMAGVREVDPRDVWFTTIRNASVQLAERLRAAALKIGVEGSSARVRLGRIGPKGEPVWTDGPPGRHAPLTWLRPVGEVAGTDGQASLGVLHERVEPSKGFLNLMSLPGERFRPGDVLSYSSTAVSLAPRVQLAVRYSGQGPVSVPDTDVFSREVAGYLSRTGVVLPRVGVPSGAAVEVPLFEVIVGVPTITETASVTNIAGEWRGRLWPPGLPGQGEPLVKAGLAYSEERKYEVGRPLLVPRDRGGELAAFSGNALERLVSMVVSKGLARAVGAESSAAIERRSEP